MQIKEQIKMEAEKQSYSQDGDDKYQSGYECGFLSGANFVLELMGWVKVEDRLPEASVNVLAYDATRAAVAVCYMLKGSWIVNKDFTEGFDSTTYDGAVITHWQPLPPPPKD